MSRPKKYKKRADELLRQEWIWNNDVLQTGMQKYPEYREKFGKSLNVFYKDKNACLAQLRERVNQSKDLWLSDILERNEEIYQRALNNPRALNVALGAVENLAKLQGLYTQKVEVSNPVEYTIKWN